MNKLLPGTRCYVDYTPNSESRMAVYFDRFDENWNFVDSRGYIWPYWRIAPQSYKWNAKVFAEYKGEFLTTAST
jgi:hypothetical protein